MSRFDVVVADGGRVISYVVEGPRTEMRDIIANYTNPKPSFRRRFSSSSQSGKKYIFDSPELFALGSHVGLNAAQAASSRLPTDIVERQIVSVDIAGGDEAQMHFAVAGLHTQGRQHEKEK